MLKLIHGDRWVPVTSEPAGMQFLRRTTATRKDILALGAIDVWKQMLREALATLRLHPPSVGARYSRALALEKLGRLLEAKAAYQNYLEYAPADKRARRRLNGFY